MTDVFGKTDSSTQRWFWISFITTIIYVILLVRLASDMYFGDDSGIEHLGLPSYFNYLGLVLVSMLMLIGLRRTIHFYRIMMFGVKSEWRN